MLWSAKTLLISALQHPLRNADRRDRPRLNLDQLDDRIVPSTLEVTTNLDDNSAGSLRSIIQQADSDGTQGIADTIEFSPSLNGDHFLLQEGPLVLTAGANVSIWTIDEFTDSEMQIFLNGDEANIFQVQADASLSLNQITLAGGVANQYDGTNGGAINNLGTLSINDCSFTNNSATGMGGAIYNAGTLTGTYSSTFSGNTANVGGALASTGTVELNSNFSKNTASGNFGGSVYSTGIMTLSGTITGSSSKGDGGAIYNDGFMTLGSCSLSDNISAQNGGAIYNDANGTMTVIQSTLAENSSGAGGAIENGGTMTLTADTVSANSALYGGGITTQASLTLLDTIVAGNTLTANTGAAPDLRGTVNSASTYNLIGDGTGETGINNGTNNNQVGNAKLPIDPKLGSLDNDGNMALSPGSPAVATGGPVSTLAGNIGGGDTVIPVTDAAVFAATPEEVSLRIDNEQMWVTNVDLAANTVTVSRGFGVDEATSHNSGAPIFLSQTFGSTPMPPVSIGADQTVSAGPAVKFAISGMTAQGEVSGTLFNVTITAQDTNGNTAMSYNGQVTLTCSDGMMTPITVTIVDGVGVTPVALDKAETADTLHATDGTISGTSSPFPLLAGPLAHLTITVPSSRTAGTAFNADITGTDWFGNPASGTISLTSSDGETIPSATLSSGKAVAPVTLDHTGTDTLTASCNGATATSTDITIAAGPASSFKMSVTNTVTAGSPLTVSVTALDAYGNTATSYTGALNLATSDGQKIYPSSPKGSTGVQVTNGLGTNQIVLDKADNFTLTLSSYNSLLHKTIFWATSNSITVNPGSAVKLVITTPTTVPLDVTTPFTVTAEDQFNNVAQYSSSTFGSAIAIEATNLPWIVINGVPGGYSSVNLQNGKGQGTFEPQIAGTFYLTFSSEGSPLSGKSNPITVGPDWFSNNIPDPGIQTLARTDYYSNSPHSLTFDNVLGIFNQAETELLALADQETGERPNPATNAEDEVLLSLRALAKNGMTSNVNMPVNVQYLATQVAIPNTNDTGFLAYYYSQNPDPEVPVTYSSSHYYFGIPSGPEGVAEASQLTALVNQWFNGTVYPNSAVNGGAYNGDAQPPYDAAAGSSAPSLYGPAGIPLVTDVVQGSLGDCWLLSTLADMAYHDPSMIENMFTVNDNGTYTIHLYKLYPSGPHNATSAYSVYVTVDDELPTEMGGFPNSTGQQFNINTPDGAPDFAGVTNGALWVALIEKAAAQLAGPGSNSSYLGYSYQALSGDGDTPPITLPGSHTNPLNWYAGNAEYSLLEITGESSAMHVPFSAGDVVNGLNASHFMIVATGLSGVNTNPILVDSHEYAVLGYNSSNGGDFLLYNPWGLQSLGTLSAGIDGRSTTTTIYASGVYSAGEVIEIDQELMEVTGTGNGTISVLRGYDGTTITSHSSGAAINLSLANNTGFSGWPIVAQGMDNNRSVYGLWWAPSSVVQSGLGFLDLENTTQSYGSSSYGSAEQANSSTEPAINAGVKSIATASTSPRVSGRRFASQLSIDNTGSSANTPSGTIATKPVEEIRGSTVLNSKSTDMVFLESMPRKQKETTSLESDSPRSGKGGTVSDSSLEVDELELALMKHSISLGHT